MTVALAAIAAVAVWWLATVLALYRLRQHPATFPATLAASTLISIVSVWLIVASAGSASILGALAAFVGAVGVWSWHEIAYLTGYVSGPVPEACPADAGLGERLRRGINACLYHELAIVVTAVMLMVTLAGSANPGRCLDVRCAVVDALEYEAEYFSRCAQSAHRVLATPPQVPRELYA